MIRLHFMKKYGKMLWIIQKSLQTFVRKFRFTLNGHILNPFWQSRRSRHIIRDMAKLNSVMKYLDIYEPFINIIKPDPLCNRNEEELVFSIWFQGEDNAPECVKSCFKSMRKFIRNRLVVIDDSSLSDWIKLPDFIIEKRKQGKIRDAHFSDICRVELLYQHGGLWFDATDFVTSGVPDDIMESDFYVYSTGANKKFSGWYSFIQNCFIRSKKHDPLLGIWRKAIHKYWEEEDNAINYFIHQLLFRKCIECNKDAACYYNKMIKRQQDSTHALWYGHKDDLFDKNLFHEYTKDAFFQKIDFKDRSAKHPEPGSMAEYIVNFGNN